MVSDPLKDQTFKMQDSPYVGVGFYVKSYERSHYTTKSLKYQFHGECYANGLDVSSPPAEIEVSCQIQLMDPNLKKPQKLLDVKHFKMTMQGVDGEPSWSCIDGYKTYYVEAKLYSSFSADKYKNYNCLNDLVKSQVNVDKDANTMDVTIHWMYEFDPAEAFPTDDTVDDQDVKIEVNKEYEVHVEVKGNLPGLSDVTPYHNAALEIYNDGTKPDVNKFFPYPGADKGADGGYVYESVAADGAQALAGSFLALTALASSLY